MRYWRPFALSLAAGLCLASAAYADPTQEALTQKAFTQVREGKYDEAKQTIAELEKINKTNPKLGLLKELLAAETEGMAAGAAGVIAPGSQNEKDQFCLRAAEGKVSGVQEMLDKGIDPNTRDQFGTTALEHAAEAGHTEVVKLLLGKGADANLKDMRGNSALMLAVWNGHTDTVKAIVSSGADVNLRNSAGLTALSIAQGKGREEIAVFLVEKGAQE
jgi:ankyrin repeat protein